MKFSLDKKARYTIFTINEDKLNSIVAPNLKTEFINLNNEGTKNVILDMDEVTFVDSSGLSAILVAKRLCENIGGVMVITNIKGNVKKLIKISQLDRVLTMYPTIQEASDYFMIRVIECFSREYNDL